MQDGSLPITFLLSTMLWYQSNCLFLLFYPFSILHAFRGLEYVLETGNIEYYPLVCADVTATFTVLSSTINAIRSDHGHRTLENSHAIVELINRLQRAEQTKLQLTAALHLERMRIQAQQQRTSSESNGERTDEDEIDPTGNGEELLPIDPSSQNLSEHQERIASLLKESIHVLRKKIGLTIEEINDVLEELRYTTVDASDN
jgi:DNA repair REX1-B